MRVTSEYYGRYQAPLDGGPLPLDGNMDLIKAVTNYFEVTDGFEISIRSDVPAGSGLGGSSTMIVSMIGAMARYVSDPGVKNFVPMNANFGLIAPLGYRVKGKKKEKYLAYAERALEEICANKEKMETLWK